MRSPLARLSNVADRLLPVNTSLRKVIEIVSVVLIVQGIAALVLFSYVSPVLGLASLLTGAFLVAVLHPLRRVEFDKEAIIGLRIVNGYSNLVGGSLGMIVTGTVAVLAVMTYNLTLSNQQDIGDIDLLVISFGLAILLYPVVRERYEVEICFAIIFIGLTVLLLAIPQIIGASLNDSGASSVGNWYVHYMLAAPFAHFLDLVGIPSASSGNLVTIQFQDGSVYTLTISAYCAGLYSFTIFLSAFVAFVLIFERLPRGVLVIVLALGLVIAYLGNLVRMIVIGVIGYYHGIDALHWAHENVGWVIFLAWSSVFWWLLLGYVSKRSRKTEAVTEAN